jgi:hypothetical protein
MPGRLHCRAALLSFILLCAAVESPPPALPAQSASPQIMQGVYRYQVRGLTAGAGVFTTMLFKAPGMYHAAAHRMLPGFLKILGGMAKVSNDPSTKEMHDFLRSGDLFGLDLSTIPVAAGFGVEIEFTLELVKKEWRLKRGSYRWSSDHHFSVSAGEGSLSENVRGQGSGVLDPKTSSITLVNIGKKGSPRLELSGLIPISSGFTAGKSVFANGPMRWSFDHGRGEMEVVMGGLASHREKMEGAENLGVVGHISFSKSGPPERVVKGMEVYQDLLDSGVVEEWELWDGPCRATIESPANNEELVYNTEQPGRLVDKALAKVTPSHWEDDLEWLLPEISESELKPPRPDRKGNDFDIEYTDLPEKNSAFSLTEVVAEFGARAKAAGCQNPKLSNVGYFFPRFGLNHGGPPGPKSEANADKRPNPNWFHYWMQTKANPGLPTHFVRYGGHDKTCLDARGYYQGGKDYIVICDLGDFVGWNPLAPGYHAEGIDMFASTMLHERQHYANFRSWWGAGYEPTLDTDGDYIPDLLEHTVPVPPEVKTKPGIERKFDPNKQDTFGYGTGDEHYLAWAAALRWKQGSADTEDWSCPGHQTFVCGQ